MNRKIAITSVLSTIAVLVTVGCSSNSQVADYCSYGAVSAAQLQGCIDHVSDATVESYDTNAAQYARGDLDDCLEDSGPFCEPR